MIRTKSTDLLVIFGPPAVGKMTVGQEVAARTNFRVFHNHMTIDMLVKIFPFGSKPFKILCEEFRRRVIEEAVAHPEFGGLIFTYVWALEDTSDRRVAAAYKDIVERAGGKVMFVELEANFDERLIRNRSENRLTHKNKAKFEKTEATLREWETKHHMNSKGDFFYPDQHLKINNSHLSAAESAEKIIQHFGIPRIQQN